jgi:Beta-lactamase enzyme family
VNKNWLLNLTAVSIAQTAVTRRNNCSFFKAFGLLLASALPLSGAQAQVFTGSFEDPIIEAQFPLVGGVYRLTPGPASTQLTWLLSELAAGETTTPAEVNAHFSPGWLSQISVTDTINFINSVRTSFPNAQVIDVISVTPMRITALIDTPGSPAPHGFLNFGTQYQGAGLIDLFGNQSFTSVQYLEDTTLTLAQAVSKFTTLAAQTGIFVGRINSANQCVSMQSTNQNSLFNTASIFKTWVLGGVARGVQYEQLASGNSVTLDGTKNVAGSVITSAPNGTVFNVGDLSTMMMGNSDNTATDIMHTLAGRSVVDQIFTDFNMAQPTVMTPLLGISEQFHFIYNVTVPNRNAYLSGTEAFQQNFLQTDLIPRGRFTGGTLVDNALLNTATWKATPVDVCNAMAALRRFPQKSTSLALIDRAFGSQAAQPFVRNQWNRVWYKGGSLASTANNFHVLTHAWLLEDQGRDPYVLVAMANDTAGGITGNLTQFQIQSVAGRILQLLAEMP